MNKEQLKELVKAHFNLVDRTPVTAEKFGELYDENKAFKIVFPGDTLKVGDEVKVVTAEGQESLAPDGYHKLEDGTTIKTEGSSVVEIESPEGKSEEEMAEEGGSLEAVKDEEKAAEKVGFAGPKESISNVEGTTAQNATTDVNGALKPMGKTEAEIQGEVMAKVKMAVDEAIASEIAGIKEEMKSLKAKFEEMAKAPAAGKTTMSAESKENFSSENLQAKQMKIMAELLKNKK
jgi:hypothetical protein